MIKVPATAAGMPAIEALISEGINVNVTLIFSLDQYQRAADAYLSGLAKGLENGQDLHKVASVASFFVSRVDASVDPLLEGQFMHDLQGKIAIANAKAAYAKYEGLYHGDRWERLEGKGARFQRLLWASTSTKNPIYPDTMYIDGLIGRNTVNTVPPATLQAFLDHGAVDNTLERELQEAIEQLHDLEDAGIDLEAITGKLLDDGVVSFENAFQRLMEGISSKREQLSTGFSRQSLSLGDYGDMVEEAIGELEEQRIIRRIWEHDHTVWKERSEEITNRLGWLNSAEVMSDNLHILRSFAQSVRDAGFEKAILLGMGGSSLAPEVFRKIFGFRDSYLDLAVLDSTDPAAVQSVRRELDLAKTLFIVSTKSGGTAETLSFFKYFYNQLSAELGEEQAGGHFIAITDRGTALEELADRFSFRATFLNDPNIGGRYSALSYFGLVPAALLGVDVEELLERAMAASTGCDSCVPVRDNPSAWLGAVLGELAKVGRDKLTLITSPSLTPFSDWAEQLIAESTGKEGKGILPVVREPPVPPDAYGPDRLFVYLRLAQEDKYDALVMELEKAGHPVLHLHLHDLYDLGGEFFNWEMATAVASARLGINPFDQPNVEAAKELTREKVRQYEEEGSLKSPKPSVEEDGVALFLPPSHSGGESQVRSVSSLREALAGFLQSGEDGSYVSLQAYVHPTEEANEILEDIRRTILRTTHMATTSGFGPRFLHSTGQLHKGDAGKGLFMQLTTRDREDVDIPSEAGSETSSLTFGILKEAQAQGDRNALLNAGRRVLRVHFNKGTLDGLMRVRDALQRMRRVNNQIQLVSE
jgi:transaldolase/glucose-6-phosphate isomerase